MVQCVVKIFVG